MNPPESGRNTSYVTLGQFIAGLSAMIGFLTVAVALIAIFVNQPGRNGDLGPVGPTGPTGPTGPAGVGIGAIMAYAGPVNIKIGEKPIIEPIPGWLLCNGAPLSDNQEGGKYRKLIMLLRGTWGNNTGANVTPVNLPDLRGLFLRGVDHGANNDPNSRDRINGGDRVGSMQTDSNAEHNHILNRFAIAKKPDGKIWKGLAKSVDKECFYGYVEAGDPRVTEEPIVTSFQKNASKETRPKNAYVNWIIKY